MDAWHFLVLSAGKHDHKIPPFRGGGSGLFKKGGVGSADFILVGVGIFPIVKNVKQRISSRQAHSII